MNDRNTYLTAALGFVAGGIAGAVVALLTAPQSGQETREMMDRKFRDTRDAALDKLRDTKESAIDMKERVVRQAAGLRDETARRAEAVAAALAGRGPRAEQAEEGIARS
jgi:gas vesicle protein